MDKPSRSNKTGSMCEFISDPFLPHPPPPQDKKAQAKLAKEQGNEAYKKKSFDQAIGHYQRAIELDPTDIVFYNNLAAVHYEKQDYRQCIADCERGIEVGRENGADFKLMSKSFTRIGNSYKRLNDLHAAKTAYEKAMSEHRTPEVKTLLSEVEARIKEEARKAYIDPVKAEEEKERGNELFKKGDYGAAVRHYSEAIQRNPDDPKLYSNRAACYTKLAAFDLGLKDCERCLELDEKFLKGWIRKGKILQGMQQPSKAIAAYQSALALDPANNEALEGFRACRMSTINADSKEVLKNAMSDPEIAEILRDPAMRLILEQMQSDPKAAQE